MSRYGRKDDDLVPIEALKKGLVLYGATWLADVVAVIDSKGDQLRDDDDDLRWHDKGRFGFSEITLLADPEPGSAQLLTHVKNLVKDGEEYDHLKPIHAIRRLALTREQAVVNEGKAWKEAEQEEYRDWKRAKLHTDAVRAAFVGRTFDTEAR
jgi:hypothetical protein